MARVLILHYHEIWLKRGNKNYFLSRLVAAVKRSLADLPLESLKFVSDRFVLVPKDESALPAILARLRRVFGLAYVAPACAVAPELGEISAAACAMMEERNPISFAVRAKIADHDFGMQSMEVERVLGRAILDHLRARGRSLQVNLEAPEVTCRLEVVPGKAYVYMERVEGPGGLPPATGGRLVTLLSGGFDSAVAAYKMMRRGAHVSFVHFYSNPSSSRGSSKPVAEELVRALTPYQFTSRLYLVPFEPIQRRIVVAAPDHFLSLIHI